MVSATAIGLRTQAAPSLPQLESRAGADALVPEQIHAHEHSLARAAKRQIRALQRRADPALCDELRSWRAVE